MSLRSSGRAGNLLRFGLGARNWFISQMEGDPEWFVWCPPEGGRSASDIVTHAAWVVSVVSTKIAEDFDIKISPQRDKDKGNLVSGLQAEIYMAYKIYEHLCNSLKEDQLDSITKLPPPSQVREGSVERVLRIMAGYHVIHHAGQIAMILRRAKNALT